MVLRVALWLYSRSLVLVEGEEVSVDQDRYDAMKEFADQMMHDKHQWINIAEGRYDDYRLARFTSIVGWILLSASLAWSYLK